MSTMGEPSGGGRWRRRGAAVAKRRRGAWLVAMAVVIASLGAVLAAPTTASAATAEWTWTPSDIFPADAVVGTPYSQAFTATSPDAVGPLTYTWVGGSVTTL